MLINKMLKILFSFCLLTFFHCSAESQETFNPSIDLGFNSRLVFEDNKLLLNHKNLIEAKAREAVGLVNAKMLTENITIRIRVSSTNVIPEIGIGGYNPNPNEIILSIDPNFSDIEQSLRNELGPTIAHEMHHAKRRRTVGYGSSLLQAMITEGMADSFSMEVYKINPPIWSTVLTASELENWIQTARVNWNETPYNHNEWFFGISEIPRWTGYAIGFKLVQDYLIRNPSIEPSDIVNEPASSLVE